MMVATAPLTVLRRTSATSLSLAVAKGWISSAITTPAINGINSYTLASSHRYQWGSRCRGDFAKYGRKSAADTEVHVLRLDVATFGTTLQGVSRRHPLRCLRLVSLAREVVAPGAVARPMSTRASDC